MRTLTIPRFGAEFPGQGGRLGAILRGAVVDGIEQPDRALIVPDMALAEIESITWGNGGKDLPGATSRRDGMANTLTMAEAGHDIAKRMRALSTEGHTDWYLPAIDELRLLAATVPELFSTADWYWSSTQTSRDLAWIQVFEGGYSGYYAKGVHCRAVALRSIPLL